MPWSAGSRAPQGNRRCFPADSSGTGTHSRTAPGRSPKDSTRSSKPSGSEDKGEAAVHLVPVTEWRDGQCVADIMELLKRSRPRLGITSLAWGLRGGAGDGN